MSDWRPGCDRAALAARAALFAQIRDFFSERGVLEVDTPVLARYGVTDPGIEPLCVHNESLSPTPLYLQTSPEYAMKRLLAAGSGPIYQLSKVFRAGEQGARHNPEFTMLEWYRPGFSPEDLMSEVSELVAGCLGDREPTVTTYQNLFEQALGIDPWIVDAATLEQIGRENTGFAGDSLDRDGWLDLLMTHCIEPTLRGQGLVFVSAYPPTQAALARCQSDGDRQVAARFELYVDGVELANGYHELLDADELERRAVQDNQKRRCDGLEARELDPRLLAAMRSGLPDCSGVALGVDRLLMLQCGAEKIDEVIPFAWDRV